MLTRVSSTDLFEPKISLSLVAISSSSSSLTGSSLRFSNVGSEADQTTLLGIGLRSLPFSSGTIQ